MADFFLIVSDALTGLLDITNQVIGIMLAWTIFEVPLLFVLATFDFLTTLLTELSIIKSQDEDTPPLSPPNNL